MMIAVVPLVAAIVGALTYALSSNTKVVELGRLVFFAAMIALMVASASHVVHVG